MMIREDYDTFGKFLDTIEQRPHLRGNYAKEDTHGSWYGCIDYQDALDLAIGGWKIEPDCLEMIKTEYGKDEFIGSRYKTVNAVAGYQPIVANALMGHPKSMITGIRTPKRKKVLDIYYDCGFASYVKAKTIENIAIELGSSIISLEKSGYAVNLYTIFLNYKYTGDENGNLLVMKIKSSGQLFNLQKMLFMSAHPSMFRVFKFLWYETLPNGFDMTLSYGKSGYYAYDKNIQRYKKYLSQTFPDAIHIVGAYLNEIKIHPMDEIKAALKCK